MENWLFRHDGFHITSVVLTLPILRNAASAWLSIYGHDRDSWPAVNARLYSHRSSHRSYHFFQPRLPYGNGPYRVSKRRLKYQNLVWHTELATNIQLFFNNVYVPLFFHFGTFVKKFVISKLLGFPFPFLFEYKELRSKTSRMNLPVFHLGV